MHLVFSPFSVPSLNLAIEEYYFLHSSEDYLILYLNHPSVIIGSNQALLFEVDQSYCKQHNIPVYRRMSGGGAVYHDLGNIVYSFISTKKENENMLDGSFLNPIVDVLASLNIPVKVGKRKDLWLTDGFKISGTASHISRGRMMKHGTLLYDANLKALKCSLDSKETGIRPFSTPSVPSPVKNIRTYLEENGLSALPVAEFMGALIDAFLTYYDIRQLTEITSDDMEKILVLQTRYESEEWIFKK